MVACISRHATTASPGTALRVAAGHSERLYLEAACSVQHLGLIKEPNMVRYVPRWQSSFTHLMPPRCRGGILP
jgi:hypothetical protein